MPRPIDADALIGRSVPLEGLDGSGIPYVVRAVPVIFIDDTPTLSYKDLVPQGEWIEDGYAEKPCVCSYCGEEAHYTSTFRETFDYDWEENLQPTGYEEIREYEKSNFCPNCGARMTK